MSCQSSRSHFRRLQPSSGRNRLRACGRNHKSQESSCPANQCSWLVPACIVTWNLEKIEKRNSYQDLYKMDSKSDKVSFQKTKNLLLLNCFTNIFQPSIPQILATPPSLISPRWVESPGRMASWVSWFLSWWSLRIPKDPPMEGWVPNLLLAGGFLVLKNDARTLRGQDTFRDKHLLHRSSNRISSFFLKGKLKKHPFLGLCLCHLWHHMSDRKHWCLELVKKPGKPLEPYIIQRCVDFMLRIKFLPKLIKVDWH